MTLHAYVADPFALHRASFDGHLSAVRTLLEEADQPVEEQPAGFQPAPQPAEQCMALPVLDRPMPDGLTR